MSQDRNAPGAERHDLVIDRLVRAPRATVWRAWTDPELLKQWWCPRPWSTEVKAFDLRPGGAFHTFMRGPDGGSSDNPGAFLEVVPQSRIAFTSMLLGGWRPGHAMDAVHRHRHDGRRGRVTRYVARVCIRTRRRATATRRWASSTAGTPASTSSRPWRESRRRAEAAADLSGRPAGRAVRRYRGPVRAAADDDGGRGVHRAPARMRCESRSSSSTTTATG